MTEILSQNEIDSLLTEIASGGVSGSGSDSGSGADEGMEPAVKETARHAPSYSSGGKAKKVKIYDFKRPDKFSKDQIRTLQMIHEAFARLTTTSMSAQLRTLVQIHVSSVDQLTYDEFIRSVPNPTTLALADMNPLKGNTVFEMDPNITFAVIDRLLGGKGKSISISRELTDIELNVIETVIERMLLNLKEAWQNVIELTPSLTTIENNPHFAQIVAPNEMVVVVAFEVKVGDTEGSANLCFPHLLLEPLMAKLSAQYWYSSARKEKTDENLANLKNRMRLIKIPVTAELGCVDLTVRDLLNIKTGDVVPLNQKKTKDIIFRVGEKQKFYCRPGTVGKKIAVQITGIIPEEGGE